MGVVFKKTRSTGYYYHNNDMDAIDRTQPREVLRSGPFDVIGSSSTSLEVITHQGNLCVRTAALLQIWILIPPVHSSMITVQW
ncbi:Hypothetical protein NTJ_04844 [Nesidiocoris tenuis]|uniref:Uncharacterized protein n=1 Tax=Nesidiocoris tenuis TaxID=355587 RepID=A0ABN7AIF5_9HEMI|nr:Hypothetical protein NTJ_04844 [Nesidiocoris tenuis]